MVKLTYLASCNWRSLFLAEEEYRYIILEAIRGYSLEVLAATQEMETIRRLRALCYLDLTEEISIL